MDFNLIPQALTENFADFTDIKSPSTIKQVAGWMNEYIENNGLCDGPLTSLSATDKQGMKIKLDENLMYLFNDYLDDEKLQAGIYENVIDNPITAVQELGVWVDYNVFKALCLKHLSKVTN